MAYTDSTPVSELHVAESDVSIKIFTLRQYGISNDITGHANNIKVFNFQHQTVHSRVVNSQKVVG
jgi:hypothetical protein